MKAIENTIAQATKVMNANNLPFVTIWETTGRKTTSYGFNFENAEVGHSVKEQGIKRVAIEIIRA